MRTLFALTFIANLILTVVVLVVGPDTMAIHFGFGGNPDNWASAEMHALLMAVMDVFLFLIFWFTPQLIRVTPGRWVNLPNKDYWLKEENRGGMEQILSRELYLFGAVIFAFMFVVGLLVLQANFSDPVRLREDLFWPPFLVVMGYTVYWCFRIYRAFRVPAAELQESGDGNA